MLTIKNLNINSSNSNLSYCSSLSSSPPSPSSVTSNEENSYHQPTMGFTVNGNSLLNGDGLLGLANTIDDNGNSLGSGNHSNGGGVKRKREKLDHLTEEEKLMRRKLKNRISAQTARDRKKEKLTDLESKVAQISKINCILLKENAELKKQLDLSKTSELRQLNDKLEAENKMLKERLTALEEKVNGSIIKMDTSEDNSNNIKNKKQATPLKPNNLKSEANYASPVFEKSKVDSIESAAFINGSLQKNQEPTKEISAIWIKLLIHLLIVMGMSAKKSSNGYIDAPSNCWTKGLNNCLMIPELKTVDPILMKQLADYLQLRRNQKREIWNQCGT